MREKPTPPSRAAIDADVAANLAALGIQDEIPDREERLELVFAAAVTFAREHKRLASSVELGRILGYSQALAHKSLQALAESGRMIRRGSGSQARYLPKVA